MGNLALKVEAIQKEIKQAELMGTQQAIDDFLDRHPIFRAIYYIYIGGAWFLRACFWTLVLLLGVVGLKVLWLAVLYMWRLV